MPIASAKLESPVSNSIAHDTFMPHWNNRTWPHDLNQQPLEFPSGSIVRGERAVDWSALRNTATGSGLDQEQGGEGNQSPATVKGRIQRRGAGSAIQGHEASRSDCARAPGPRFFAACAIMTESSRTYPKSNRRRIMMVLRHSCKFPPADDAGGALEVGEPEICHSLRGGIVRCRPEADDRHQPSFGRLVLNTMWMVRWVK